MAPLHALGYEARQNRPVCHLSLRMFTAVHGVFVFTSCGQEHYLQESFILFSFPSARVTLLRPLRSMEYELD